MSDWTIDNLQEFIKTVLKQYPEPEERYTFSAGEDDPEAEYRVGKEEVPKYRNLVGIGSDIVNAAVKDQGYDVKDSVQTNLAEIPYVAVLRDEETKSTQYGRYVVYLFDPVQQTAHLSLAVGATAAEKYAKRVHEAGIQPDRNEQDVLTWLTNWYRGQCEVPAEFETGRISLTDSLKRSDGYGNGSICHKSYDLDDLPTNSQLIDDLTTLLGVYQSLIETEVADDRVTVADRRAWHVSTEGFRWDAWESDGIASIGYELNPGEFDTPPRETASIEETSIRKDEGQGFAYLFTQTISEGDLVIAAVRRKEDPNEICGFGKVTDMDPDYPPESRHESIKNDSHFVGVEWASFETWVPVTLGTNDPLGLKTLREVSESGFEHLFGTTIGHAVAGGLYPDIATAGSRTAVPLDTSGGSSRDDKREEEAEDPPDDQMSDDDLERWQLGEVAYSDPNFGISPDEIDLGDELYFQNETQLLEEILGALHRGDHLLFVGPPGTGKSKLAKLVTEELVGNSYEMATATADWSTFDTIGGYRQQRSGELAFSPGLFLGRFQGDEQQPINEWLLVDEFNRANIDKAFGSLFSVLTGDDVVLPFTDGQDRDITIYGSELADATVVGTHEYVVPEDWRLLATMNTFDKSSLYDLSYALSRRFAYIHVPAPDEAAIDESLVTSYVDCWDGVAPTSDEIAAVVELWKTVQATRPLGPAIVRDVLAAADDDLTPGIVQYVLPQFEGLMNRVQEDVIEDIAALNLVEAARVERFGREYFELTDLEI